MREITTHTVDPDDKLKVYAVDEPGHGGANHEYCIVGPWGFGGQIRIPIGFQNGPVREAGINGVTEAALLAIVADRLRAFQAGPYPSEMNLSAITSVERALECLHQRTRDRLARKVEGTSKA